MPMMGFNETRYEPLQSNLYDPIITLIATRYNMSKFYILSQGMHFCFLKESHQDKQLLFRYVTLNHCIGLRPLAC